MIRSALVFLLLLMSVTAQVISTPTGCTTSTPTTFSINCVSGSTPPGHFVDFDVVGVHPGQLVTLFFGFSSDPYFSNAMFPLPFDLGLIYPQQSGCVLWTSAVGSITITAQTTTARIPVWVPLGVQEPLMFQAMVLDPGFPSGVALSANALEYFPN